MQLFKLIPILLLVFTTKTVSAQCDVGEMEELKSMLSSNYRASGGNLGKVRLYFKMQEGYSAENVMGQVEAAMKVRDPGGWLNPYWVVGILDNASCGKEGVIIGRWYNIDVSGMETWGKYLKNELSGIRGLSSYKVITLN